MSMCCKAIIIIIIIIIHAPVGYVIDSIAVIWIHTVVQALSENRHHHTNTIYVAMEFIPLHPLQHVQRCRVYTL